MRREINRGFRNILRLLPIPAALLFLVLTTAICADLMHGVRTLSRGESLWTKAEKQAQLDLLQFTYEQDPAFLADAARHLDIIDSDRLTRVELDKPVLNFPQVTWFATRAGNSLQDVPSAVRTYRLFRRLPLMRSAVDEWKGTDQGIAELRSILEELAGSPGLTKARAAEIRGRMRVIDHNLSQNVVAYSDTMHQAGREAESLLLFTNVVAAVVLILIGAIISQRALRRSEARFRTAFQCSPEPIVITSLATGRIVDANDKFTSAINLPRDQCIGRTTLELNLWGDEEQRNRFLSFNSKDGAPNFEFPFVDSLGNEKLFMLSAVSIRVGNEPCVLTVCKDVTERKLAEEQLWEKELQLQRAQRLESIGALAGGIAHDFNNLLMVIQGSTELIIAKLKEESDARRYAGQVLNACARAAELTNQLLAFGRKQMLQFKILDLNLLVDDTLKLIRPLMGEEIQIQLEKDSTLSKISADDGQISQVLLNLCINARDAMPEGGQLTIRTRTAEIAAGSQNLSVCPPAGNYAALDVIDTGHGIAENVKARIFEPFFTTKGLGRGTGLGLSTVYGIVKQCRGYIYVDSAENQGSKFSIYLPATSGGATEAHSECVKPASGKGTVLLVEDESILRTTMVEVLQNAGFVVLEAADADQAQEMAVTSPDVLVADLRLPGMSGLELAMWLREKFPFVGVILISGYSESAELSSLPNARYLQKPITIRRLLQEVCSCLESCAAARPGFASSRLPPVPPD